MDKYPFTWYILNRSFYASFDFLWLNIKKKFHVPIFFRLSTEIQQSFVYQWYSSNVKCIFIIFIDFLFLNSFFKGCFMYFLILFSFFPHFSFYNLFVELLFFYFSNLFSIFILFHSMLVILLLVLIFLVSFAYINYSVFKICSLLFSFIRQYVDCSHFQEYEI